MTKVNLKYKSAPNCICPVCNIEFYASPYRIERLNGIVYCSMRCKGLASRGKSIRKKPIQTRNCTYCGNEFIVTNYEVNHTTPKFCSRECMGAYNTMTRRIVCHCAFCGKEMIKGRAYMLQAERRNGGKVCCSHKCSFAMNRIRGKNHLEADFHVEFPQLAYTGKGEWLLTDTIGSMNPDFILPGTNKVIELFGDSWHVGEDPQERIDRLKNLGFDTIIIWESDFRNHLIETLENVRCFLSG